MTHAPTLSLEDTLKRVRRVVLNQYYTRSDKEDLAQEACIKAWMWWEDGTKSDSYITHYAIKYVTRYMGRAPQPFTGSHRDVVNVHVRPEGERTREKIKLAQTEYRELHGDTPNAEQVSRMTGIPSSNVRHHVKRMKSTIRPTGDHLTFEPLEYAADMDEEKNPRLVEESFESALVDQIAVREAVGHLTSRQKRILYGVYWQDQNQAHVAKDVGVVPSRIFKQHKSTLTELAQTLKEA